MVPTAPWGPQRSGSACSGHTAADLMTMKVKQRAVQFGLDILCIWNVWAGRGRLVLTGGAGGGAIGGGGECSSSREERLGEELGVAGNMLGHTGGSYEEERKANRLRKREETKPRLENTSVSSGGAQSYQ